MDDMDGWQERVKEICANSTTWWLCMFIFIFFEKLFLERIFCTWSSQIRKIFKEIYLSYKWTLIDTPILGQCGSGSNGNEGVIQTSQMGFSVIPKTPLFLVGKVLLLCSQSILSPTNRGTENLDDSVWIQTS